MIRSRSRGARCDQSGRRQQATLALRAPDLVDQQTPDLHAVLFGGGGGRPGAALHSRKPLKALP